MKPNPHEALSAVPVVATLLVALCLGMVVPTKSSPAAEPGLSAKPTIVLVHGAFAESSSWNGVVTRLLARGYPVMAVANPLRGLRFDADYLAAVFQSIRGPIVAVGHSYGGSVITDAAVGNPKVKALVYVAGLAPGPGESAADISDHFPGGTLGPALAPPVALPDGGKDLYIQQDKFHAQFAADIPEAAARLMAATQRPILESAFQEHSEAAAWKTIPSWFIFGSLDKNIPEAAHSFMARRANAKETINIKGASHVVMISHPEEVATLIDHAALSPWTEPPATEASLSPARSGAESPSQGSSFGPAPVVLLPSEPPARLIVDSPLPEQLARGYVVVRYRAENVRIMPVYGPSALGISPRLGHLHITVDELPWHWLDASGDPLSINGLAPGQHKILLELQNPIHKTLDSVAVNFEIPQLRAAHR